jgi:3',5'-cyclic AMP phosphodiesterase CpdA
MRTIIHISDLHFGAADRTRADGLLRVIAHIKPDLVVVSGDLTQRGRTQQYQQASDYLGQISRQQLIVPGNHDGAYINPLRRFFSPLARYQSVICDDLCPSSGDGELYVVGASSVRPFAWDWRAFWKNGRLDNAQIGRISEAFAAAPGGACRVLVVHHPLVNGRNDRRAECICGRRRLLASLRACGVELVLSGHLHKACARVAPGAAGEAPVLCVNAGTAISTRLRHEPNSFNLLSVSGDSISVTVYTWAGMTFVPGAAKVFARTRSTTVEPSVLLPAVPLADLR